MRRIFIALYATVTSAPRERRDAYQFADGIELILGSYNQGFSCEGKPYGYYADVGNDCRIFHVCWPVEDPNGTPLIYQWSFFCGNQTMFNQLSLTCDFPEFSLPCNQAESYYSKNDRFGDINAPAFSESEHDLYLQNLIAYQTQPSQGKKENAKSGKKLGGKSSEESGESSEESGGISSEESGGVSSEESTENSSEESNENQIK